MSNNDNTMARFLFAILQQKCLKDIDWNKVARNPILSQEITNGHAARMRYSRFRAAMLGLEPQRRNRTNPSKSRVSKRKRDDGPKPKKEENGGNSDAVKTEDATNSTAAVKSERRSITQQSPTSSQPSMMPTAVVKSEAGLTHPSYTRGHQRHHPSVLSVPSPKTKQETIPTAAAIITPTTPMPEPYPFGIATAAPTTTSTAASAPVPFTDIHSNHPTQMRLLTPSSDSDILQGSAHNHNPNHNHSFIPPSPVQTGTDLLHHHHSPAASAPSPYDFTSYDAAASPWHSQHHHAHQYHGYHSPASVYSAGFVNASAAATTTGAGAAGGAYTLDTGYGAFCGEHHPHHLSEGEGLGSVHPGSIFRERELEMGMGIGMGMDGAAAARETEGQGMNLKHEWEAGEY
ncbi:hypothetical protein MFIFM68171_03266 [Madurella fahalii]|uniref:Myb-like DNA-binding domain-containing protein n=1 Tax=Madurella fahalii TaxID=1157608 RepID=A0ABQ0G5L0_9PEZI